jgi:hypothetical protein
MSVPRKEWSDYPMRNETDHEHSLPFGLDTWSSRELARFGPAATTTGGVKNAQCAMSTRAVAPAVLISSALVMLVVFAFTLAGEDKAVVPTHEAGHQSGMDSDGGAPAANGGPTGSTETTAPVGTELSCDGNLRALVPWESTDPVEASPQALADRFADATASERVTVESLRNDTALAFLIRADGTASAELHLYRDERGWRMGGWEACADTRVRLQR